VYVNVTGCDLDKSFVFNKTAKITDYECFPIHVKTYIVDSILDIS